MFQSQNRIIIVDDNDRDLLTLAKKFSDKGLTYKLIHYQQFDDYEREKLTGVRLAFFDINLVPGGQNVNLHGQEYNYKENNNLSSVYNSLAGAIRSIISPNNGPFILIFWSLNTQLISNFIEYVNERNIDLPKPLAIKYINKADANNIDAEIKRIIKETSIRLLYSFERKCEIAAVNTINQIFQIIPKDESSDWGQQDSIFDTNLKKIFSKMALSKLGEHAKEHPDKAIYESLIPLMGYELVNFLPDDDWRNFLGNLDNAEYPNGFDYSKLNSIYHLDLKSNVTLNQRGAVFSYNITTEEGVDPIYYFKHLEERTKNLFNKFIRFDNNFSDYEKRHFRENSLFALIEISPACDYSQNKNRNLNYLLALITPIVEDEKELITQSESILHKDIPIIHFNQKKYKIWINLNYSFSNIDGVASLTKPLFVLKKELVDMIGNRYANHISRIGITSF